MGLFHYFFPFFNSDGGVGATGPSGDVGKRSEFIEEETDGSFFSICYQTSSEADSQSYEIGLMPQVRDDVLIACCVSLS
jgi:hypothetical protein